MSNTTKYHRPHFKYYGSTLNRDLNIVKFRLLLKYNIQNFDTACSYTSNTTKYYTQYLIYYLPL